MEIEPRCAIIIPAYNHYRHLREVAEKTLSLGWPVIVVDDGSEKPASDSLAPLAGLTIVRHERNLGKGAALLTGFAAAAPGASWAVTIDADGQHVPEEIPALVRAIPKGKRPLILGNRQGMEERHVPWTSRWGRSFSNFWVWAACGRWFSDSQSGFRIYPLPEAARLGARARRYQFEVEILIRAVWRDISVIEVPVRVHYGGKGERISHFRPWLDFWRNTRTFARLVAMRFFIPLKLRK